MRVWLLALVVFAGCGRIGFGLGVGPGAGDALGDDGAAAGDSTVFMDAPLSSGGWTLLEHRSKLCPASGMVCGVSMGVVTAGHVLVVVTAAQPSAAGNATIASVTGGGGWVHSGNCAGATLAVGIDCASVASTVPGTPVVTVTFAGPCTNMIMEVLELSFTGTQPVLDDEAGFGLAVGTNPIGLSSTPVGHDAIVQALAYRATVTSVAPYTMVDILNLAPVTLAVALELDSSDPMAPGWQTGTSDGAEAVVSFRPGP